PDRRYGLQHLHRILRPKILQHRSSDSGVRKDSEERFVGTANAIVVVDGGDGAHHSLQQLSREGTLATCFQDTAAHFTEVSLHLPDGADCNKSTNRECKDSPQVDGTSGVYL